ncbi:MAG TPA: PDDEXK nuclease domain-containing protein [Chitinophagaceae bacterium]|nr:PDDEXK nuclease domain-containing protein [Chitinophagaceae bacterium]
MSNISSNELANKISELLKDARKKVAQTINRTMVVTYFEIGRLIVEEEQNGKDRATYGKKIIKDLSKKLTKEFDKGFSVTNIQQMRRFYLVYSKQQTLSAKFKKSQTPSDEFKLSWSHYLKLMRIDDENERKFYEIEAYKENKTIGIVLCQDKSESVVKYTLPENSKQIFASKYLTVLPSKKVLRDLIAMNQ